MAAVDEKSPLAPASSSPDAPEAEDKGFPKSVYFIISNEFCERYSFYGMKTILALYLVNFLSFSEDGATASIHSFNMFAYFFPLMGGLMADTWLGKYHTILYLSIVYCIGNVIIAVTSIPGVTGEPPHWWGIALGLGLLAIGTGGIKPCVSAFGGDQFDESNARAIQTFFAFFYFSINAGSMLSTIVTPILRSDVQCFGGDCYPLAFGVPAVLLMVATGIFVAGRYLTDYKIREPEGNVMTEMCAIIYTAMDTRQAFRSQDGKLYKTVDKQVYSAPTSVVEAPGTPGDDDDAEDPEDDDQPFENDVVGLPINWNRAKRVHGEQKVNDVQTVLAVLTMLLPVPLFWTLFDQQSTRWTFQATKMENNVHMYGFNLHIHPDQMMVCNAILILTLVPIFDQFLYPGAEWAGLNLTPLRRMNIGMFMAGVAFIVTAMLQAKVEQGVFDDDGQCIDNCVNIMWQLPQYFLMTVGEVMFSITGLEFCYAEAPPRYKSVCSAAWLLTVAVGNCIVVFVAEANFFESQVTEFLFFSGLMFLVMIPFIAMSAQYKYRTASSAAVAA